MSTAVEMPTPINFSDNAVKKVKELIAEEGTPDLKLRVFVSVVAALVFNMDLPLKRLLMRMTQKLKKIM